MAKIKSIPKLQNVPALRGRIIVRPLNGGLVVQKWPRKRGPSKSPAVLKQNAWFKAASQVVKYVEPGEARRAIHQTRNTLIYPYDLLKMAMAGNYFDSLEAGGVVYTKYVGKVTPVKFQGARVPLDGNQPLASGVTLIAEWTLPSIQTADIWSPSQPSRLQVPANVNIVNVTLGWRTSLNSQNWQSVWITKNGSSEVAYGAGRYYQFPQGTTQTGPMKVVEGDYFEANFRQFQNGTLNAADYTFFVLEILDAN